MAKPIDRRVGPPRSGMGQSDSTICPDAVGRWDQSRKSVRNQRQYHKIMKRAERRQAMTIYLCGECGETHSTREPPCPQAFQAVKFGRLEAIDFSSMTVEEWAEYARYLYGEDALVFVCNPGDTGEGDE